MKAHAKAGIITFVVAIPAFLTGRLIWPPTPDISPTAAQLPYLIGLSVFDALSFGLGIAFLILAWPLVKAAAPGEKKRTVLAYLATAWLLVNWWPHDNLHIHNGLRVDGLIHIDYGFHVTLMAAAFVVMNFFLRTLSLAKKARAAGASGS